MSEGERRGGAPAEQRIAKLFEEAGYEVSQAVGEEPGTVDWFAIQKKGIARPRTYFVAWEKFDGDFEGSIAKLEAARKARGAESALGVILEGGLPPEYAAKLAERANNLITLQRLRLELSGAADRVREFTKRYDKEKGSLYYLRRMGKTTSGEIVDVVNYAKDWGRKRHSNLWIVGPAFSGRTETIERVAYELGVEFEHDPESVAPLLIDGERLEHPFGNKSPVDFFASIKEDAGSYPVAHVIRATDEMIRTYELEFVERIELLLPNAEHVERWYQGQIPANVFERFSAARKADADFERLSSAPANLSPVLDAMRSGEANRAQTIVEWTVRTISNYIESVFSSLYLDSFLGGVDLGSVFEMAAFEQFALGKQDFPLELQALKMPGPKIGILLTWTLCTFKQDTGDAESIKGISSKLIGDYFVARKIAREVAAGNRSILARYQFPKEYVLLFLAVLSPDAAAQATADRSADIQAQIEAEIERRLQLTLAHMLKRSAGSIRSNLKTMRRKMPPELQERFQYELDRISNEVLFQTALAEQTQLWHEVPNGTLESLPLREYVIEAIEPLRDKKSLVAWDISVEPELRVRANQSGLREILHCLLENAFQATVFGERAPKTPRVQVVATVEGAVVRLDVVDNGPGIRQEDRERIFEPYVTTKKGGDQPLGTGLGLSIARRYAERIGARITLEQEKERTCFIVRFVTGEEPHE